MSGTCFHGLPLAHDLSAPPQRHLFDDQPRLSQEPCRQRADAGASEAWTVTSWFANRRGRLCDRQHLRLSERGARGVAGDDPRDDRPEAEGAGARGDRRRVSGRAEQGEVARRVPGRGPDRGALRAGRDRAGGGPADGRPGGAADDLPAGRQPAAVGDGPPADHAAAHGLSEDLGGLRPPVYVLLDSQHSGQAREQADRRTWLPKPGNWRPTASANW